MACSGNSDCIKGGCNEEVCQSGFEREVVTECKYRKCYDANLYSLTCMCIEKKCQWAKYLDVDPSEPHGLIQSNLNDLDFITIDIRTPEEYSVGHIKGAINIDFYSDNFINELDSLNKDKKYLVYCRSGIEVQLQ